MNGWFNNHASLNQFYLILSFNIGPATTSDNSITSSRIFSADDYLPMTFSNRITKLFGIDYPIIQAGMIWASGWRLASAVSNAGGLGLIGSGSMYPDVLKEHIQKCKSATGRSFGVNVPLLYPGHR